jgi:hypothetical protein
MRGVYISRGCGEGGLLRRHTASENDEGSLSRAWTVVRRHTKYKFASRAHNGLVSRPRDSRHNSRAGHPGWLRCSSLTDA